MGHLRRARYLKIQVNSPDFVKKQELKWYCFCLFFFTQLESNKDSVDYLYEHQWIFSNQSRWKAFEMKSGGAFGRVRCAKGAREMREGRARECEWKAFSFYFTFLFERLLRRLFSSWKEFLLRSLHIFVKLCKLGSNVKSAPKTSVHSLPEQDPVVRNVDNAISLSSG